VTIVDDVRARGDDAVREWSLELDGVEPSRGVADSRNLPAEAVLALADRVRRWHEAQRPPDLELEVEPGVLLQRRWVPVATVGVYVPRNLVSTLVMCAVPAQVAGVGRIVVCTPPAGAGLVAAAAELLGIDEVWAVGGPQAIGWLAYVRRVDKIVGPGNAHVNEAKLAVSRDVAIDLPGGPSEVVVVADADVDRRVVELELAAQAGDGVPRRRDGRGGGGARAGAPRPARPRRGGGRSDLQRRRGVRRRGLAGRGGRLRDGREPRAPDSRVGAVGRGARDRDLSQAGHDPAVDA
jgi:histidinol dehydrogenase